MDFQSQYKSQHDEDAESVSDRLKHENDITFKLDVTMVTF